MNNLSVNNLRLLSESLVGLLTTAETTINYPHSVCWWIGKKVLSDLNVADKYAMSKYAMQLMKEWPGYSGDQTFPVPSPDTRTHLKAFMQLPKWTGEYGASRIYMVEFMIVRINQQLEGKL